ncbi:hypothetical protein FACS1894132_05030 [Clostridia bacterium]|nr:hypothetical protein FACS1894132_05030 [Clostridia bacterium]
MKTKKGFTLVELIVVIAIIGVLAAILVPAMMGWIAKANMRTANSGAKEIYKIAQTIAQELEETEYAVGKDGDYSVGSTDNGSSTLGEVDSADTVIISGKNGKPGLGADNNTFQNEVKRRFANNRKMTWRVKFYVGNATTIPTDLGTVIAAVYCKDSNLKYIGTWPEIPDNTRSSYANTNDALADAITEYNKINS